MEPGQEPVMLREPERASHPGSAGRPVEPPRAEGIGMPAKWTSPQAS